MSDFQTFLGRLRKHEYAIANTGTAVLNNAVSHQFREWGHLSQFIFKHPLLREGCKQNSPISHTLADDILTLWGARRLLRHRILVSLCVGAAFAFGRSASIATTSVVLRTCKVVTHRVCTASAAWRNTDVTAADGIFAT